jgi:hypothetical protein
LVRDTRRQWLLYAALTVTPFHVPTYVWPVDAFGIEIIKHPDHVGMPNMTQLETAFQTYDPNDKPYQSELRFRKPIYLARHNPYMLARAIMDAGRQVLPTLLYSLTLRPACLLPCSVHNNADLSQSKMAL